MLELSELNPSRRDSNCIELHFPCPKCGEYSFPDGIRWGRALVSCRKCHFKFATRLKYGVRKLWQESMKQFAVIVEK